jgi:hypothetical protein
MERVYKIKKTLKTPMILAVLISIPVFVDVFRRGYETRILVMASLLVVLFYLFTLNNLIKRLTVSDTGVALKSLFGSNSASFADIKLIDGISFGSRQFIGVTAKKYLLIPNSFDDFAAIIDDISALAREETLGKGLAQMRANIVNRRSDITMAWIVVLLLILCNVVLFFPGLTLF